jgi:uncharacterized protein (DUF2342 family)
MAGTGGGESTAGGAASNKNPVLLTGFVSGPKVVANPDTKKDESHYHVRPTPDSSKYLDVNWQDIWWIAGGPDEARNMTGGASNDRGEKSLWIDASAVGDASSFLSGDIIAGHDVATSLADMEAYNRSGPLGTTYPGCICPR